MSRVKNFLLVPPSAVTLPGMSNASPPFYGNLSPVFCANASRGCSRLAIIATGLQAPVLAVNPLLFFPGSSSPIGNIPCRPLAPPFRPFSSAKRVGDSCIAAAWCGASGRRPLSFLPTILTTVVAVVVVVVVVAGPGVVSGATV